ncbi:hypothetical protein EFE13_10405 [Leuconostoc pseudomesenteroides]|nr:hypothetical protein [Leuconostoc pseudomesenteroides]
MLNCNKINRSTQIVYKISSANKKSDLKIAFFYCIVSLTVFNMRFNLILYRVIPIKNPSIVGVIHPKPMSANGNKF